MGDDRKNDTTSPAFLHGGSPEQLQSDISEVFNFVVHLIQTGAIPNTGAAVIGIVNAAAYLCAHSPLPADHRTWERMSTSAFHKFQVLLGRTHPLCTCGHAYAAHFNLTDGISGACSQVVCNCTRYVRSDEGTSPDGN